MTHKHNSGAFTLVELLVVMAIIAILSSLAVATFSRARMNARDGRRKTDVRVYLNAFEKYRLTSGTYQVANAAGTVQSGVGNRGWGRINFKNGTELSDGRSWGYGPAGITIAEAMKGAGLIDSIIRDPKASASGDTKANQPDYVVIRCDAQTGIQVGGRADSSVAVWARLEGDVSLTEASNAESSCGGSKGTGSAPSITGSAEGGFASAFMPAPNAAGYEKDNHYFAAGSLLKR